MRYRVISVGKARERYILLALQDFRTRLRRYVPLEEIEVAPSHGGDPARALREESERILAHIAPGDHLWLLERTGKAFSSTELSDHLRTVEQTGAPRLTFVIAGTYGADEALLTRADLRWSLGPLTFLHEWARAIVLEQLYRAAKIARNEPYHH
jgi:23S rRNA (pseudouridine1915-N3)-methyltransferase